MSDDKINRLCDEVLQSLVASYEFFCAILTDNPTDNHVTTAIEKKTTLMDLIRTSNILKGNVTVKGHLIEDHAIPRMVWCKEHGVPFHLIIKQFVELNHQIGKRIDKQTKRIVRTKVMANKHCKRKALDTPDLVSKRIKHVRKETTRNQKRRHQRYRRKLKVVMLSDLQYQTIDEYLLPWVLVSERQGRAASTWSTSRAYQISKRGQIAGRRLEETPCLCRSRLSQKPNFLN